MATPLVEFQRNKNLHVLLFFNRSQCHAIISTNFFFEISMDIQTCFSKEICPNLVHFHMPKNIQKMGNLQKFDCTGT